jgi:hypothetical protein
MEKTMDHWKRILFAGAAGTSAILFLKGKKSAGFVAAGAGLAALAMEYPEAVTAARQDLPRYITRGTIALNVLSKLGNQR